MCFSNRKLGDVLFGIHAKSRTPTQLVDCLHGASTIEHMQRPILRQLGTEHQILRDRERWYEHEMLVHHPDARGDGLGRLPSGDVPGRAGAVRNLHAS